MAGTYNITKYWESMKPWDNPNHIPNISITDSKTYHEVIIPNIIRCGGISKSKLVSGATYIGSCRNSSIAMWDGKHFKYLRYKLGSVQTDTVNHFEDETECDVFVPLKEFEYD